MADPLGIEKLAKHSGETLRKLLEAAEAHGDLALAADQVGLFRKDVKDLLLYEGDDPVVAEASLALYAAVMVGRQRQNDYAKRIFLAHLAHRGIVTEAVAAQPWHPSTWFYLERQKDPDFDAQWQEALSGARDRLHAEAWRRGHDGIDKPLVHLGQITSKRDPVTGDVIKDDDGRPVPETIKEYSDTMLAMLLKRHDPGFRDSLTVDQRTSFSVDGADMSSLLAGLTDAEVAVLVKLTRAPGTHEGEQDVDGSCTAKD